MHYPWPELKFWESGEWDVIRERLDDLRKAGTRICPDRKDLFAALRRTSLPNTKVILLGQDPYPNSKFACGYAFSIPESIPIGDIPPTLQNILKEYTNDLGYSGPTSGSLLPWADRGVLLWNAIPSCTVGRSLSHDWTEWMYLTKEILEKACAQGAVVVLMGSKAQTYAKYCPEGSTIIYTSHPSPLAYMHGRKPRNSFLGSRLFSTINAKLCEASKETIDWRLP